MKELYKLAAMNAAKMNKIISTKEFRKVYYKCTDFLAPYNADLKVILRDKGICSKDNIKLGINYIQKKPKSYDPLMSSLFGTNRESEDFLNSLDNGFQGEVRVLHVSVQKGDLIAIRNDKKSYYCEDLIDPYFEVLNREMKYVNIVAPIKQKGTFGSKPLNINEEYTFSPTVSPIKFIFEILDPLRGKRPGDGGTLGTFTFKFLGINNNNYIIDVLKKDLPGESYPTGSIEIKAPFLENEINFDKNVVKFWGIK